jgi:outer membrane protein OmpA-like peptidoglycan-associated protein
MSSYEWLVGAGVGLALAALLYLFYYMTYTDQTAQQSGTDTSGGRVSRNSSRGEVETAMSNNEQSGTPDNITTAYTTGGYIFTDSTLKRHNDRAYGPAGHLTTQAAAGETSAATIATRTHYEAAVAAKADAARTVAPAATAVAAATATAAAHQTAHKTDGHKTGEAHARAEPAATKSTTAGHRADDTRDRGTPWLGWVAGIGTLLAALGLLAFNQKGESVKEAAKAQVEDVKTAVAEKVIPKVEAAVEAAKEKVAEVKAAIPEKAVIDVVVPKAEVKPEVKAEVKPEAKPEAKVEAAPAPKPEAVAAAAPAAPVPGVTNYYGAGDGSQVMAWSADAVQNPDYAEAEAAAPAEPEAKPGDTEAAAPEAVEEPAPAAEVAAAPEPEAPAAPPAAKVEPGITSYYGDGQTPDAGQPWAAEAQLNPDYAAAEPAAAAETEVAAAPEAAPVAAAEAVPGVTSTYESSTWTAPENYFAPVEPEPAAVAAAEPEPVAAPVAEPVPGVTSTYESSTWAAPENYYAPADPEPAPVVAAAAPEPEPAKTEPGVTSAYASSTWAAPANYYAPVDTCSSEVAAALKSGKLNFATSSWEILDDSYATLDKIAKLIKGCNGASVEVGGHTDNTGTAPGNQVLSEQRAKAVVKYLTGAGVSASQLKAVGYGQDKPIADNATAAGKRENRRIEFVVAGK